jgi:exopolyphosphatase/guanosine-5'-triphosphate,3'-diphosphate pyrophosphatase
MKLAAIDIGSNSIHLVIVRATPGQHLEIIDREKEMVRLGAGTLRVHMLSKETMDRAMTALGRYKKMSEANRVDRIITIATAAVRESHNAREFIERARKEVGLEVHLLPGVEEARLIALAVSEVTDFSGRRALIIDIGGGSTEFIITDGAEPEFLRSVRLGAVRLTEKFVTTDPISEAERERLVATIRGDLSRVVWEIKHIGFDFVIGTSGTITNLVDAVARAEALDGQPEASGFVSFNQTITSDQLARMNENLAFMTTAERGRIPGIEKQRADIVVAGGLLLETILAEAGADSITSCDWSLREGVILDFLKKQSIQHLAFQGLAETHTSNRPAGLVASQAESPVADVNSVAGEALTIDFLGDPRSQDVRTKSVLSVARRYDYDELHSHHVARLALEIFEKAREIHGMGEPESKLLEYAALLHDIGYHIAHNNHHRHSLYLIKNSEMPGFTATESAMIATAARYHRGSMPTAARDAKARREHEDFFSLNPQCQQTVRRLSALLRIADALDRSYQQKVKRVDCSISRGEVVFYLESDQDCDLELWSANRKAEWFQKLFRISVRFEAINAVHHILQDRVASGK